MTARYNGYYYADLRLNEVLQAIEEGHDYNYNDILKIYPDIDSGVVNGNKSKLDDAFKKSSQVIDWHRQSDWTDDSYLLIGKIRHLRAEFAFAVETLQYINQTSEDDDMRHAALIVLMRTYMDAGDISNAESTANYLDTQELSEENLVDYQIISAYFDQRAGNIEGMTEHLTIVIDFVKQKGERSRINFILGQVNQMQGNTSDAFEYYKASLAGSPPYELDFHARLNMQQVADYSSANAAARIREVYAKLLKDGKNKEYQDKIYYEMGEFERKQSLYDNALENYLKAVAVEQPNPRQKALAFLRAGELYYDIFERFELASAYYDSTIAILPQDVPDYESIAKRQGVLQEFVVQLKTIRVNDSLLSLAELNPVSLDAFLDNYLDEKEKAERIEQRKQARINAGNVNTNSGGNVFGSTTNSGSWYFYNSAAVDQGRLEFQRRWGNRELEDNWRRSTKDSFTDTDTPSGDEVTEDTPVDEPALPKDDEREANKAALLESIPTSPEAKQRAHEEIQEAYFNLGSIYRFGLEKIDRSSQSYETLVTKYPQTKFKLDGLYALYTIHEPTDKPRAEDYKQQIIREFPDSLIAKLLIDPLYLEKKEERNRNLQRIYANAYAAYDSGDYVRADQILKSALGSFEDVDFLPTVQLLAAILKSKTENLKAYELALTEFIDTYPEGPLHEEAKKLLAGLKAGESNTASKADFEYSENFDQLHLVALIYNKAINDEETIKAAIDAFNAKNFPDDQLNLAIIPFDESKDLGLMYVNSFRTKEKAEAYYPDFRDAMKDFGVKVDLNFNNFVISRVNLTFLTRRKDVAEYVNFYNRFYK